MSARRTGVADLTCWGLFREREHSPGRESDDAEILRLTGKHLETYGLHVELRAPEELVATGREERGEATIGTSGPRAKTPSRS